MAAAMNGMALHGGVIPYGGTFLIFSDYCRNAIRLSALQQSAVDLRADPRQHRAGRGRADAPAGRAGDEPASDPQPQRLSPGRRGRDCRVLAAGACGTSTRPSVLALTRQSLPQLRARGRDAAARGARYRLRAAKASRRSCWSRPARKSSWPAPSRNSWRPGVGADVVSMPCMEMFDRQDAAYKADVLPADALKRLDRGRRHPGLGTLHGWTASTSGSTVSAPRPRRTHCSKNSASPRSNRSENSRQIKRLTGVPRMATKVAINGFGRIGRLVARAMLERDDHDLELVSINDLAEPRRMRCCSGSTARTAVSPARSRPTATISSSTASTSTLPPSAIRASCRISRNGHRHRARMHRLLPVATRRAARISPPARRRC